MRRIDDRTPLTPATARALVGSMLRNLLENGRKATIRAEVVTHRWVDATAGEPARYVPVDVPHVRISGPTGEHRLSLSGDATTAYRLWEHFQGFCEVNGAWAPAVGSRVLFYSYGSRSGLVLRVGPRRALVAFTYKNGRRCEKWIPFEELTFAPSTPLPRDPRREELL